MMSKGAVIPVPYEGQRPPVGCSVFPTCNFRFETSHSRLPCASLRAICTSIVFLIYLSKISRVKFCIFQIYGMLNIFLNSFPYFELNIWMALCVLWFLDNTRHTLLSTENIANQKVYWYQCRSIAPRKCWLLYQFGKMCHQPSRVAPVLWSSGLTCRASRKRKEPSRRPRGTRQKVELWSISL